MSKLTKVWINGKDNEDADTKDDCSKDGGSLAETPWHQDESYWPDLPDKRALSFWSDPRANSDHSCSTLMCRFPMEDATVDNGCMWFVPGSHHRGLLPHQPVINSSSVQFIDHVEKQSARLALLHLVCSQYGQYGSHQRGLLPHKPVLKSIIFMRIEDGFVWNLFTIVKNLSILHLVPYFYDEYIFLFRLGLAIMWCKRRMRWSSSKDGQAIQMILTTADGGYRRWPRMMVKPVQWPLVAALFTLAGLSTTQALSSSFLIFVSCHWGCRQSHKNCICLKIFKGGLGLSVCKFSHTLIQAVHIYASWIIHVSFWALKHFRYCTGVNRTERARRAYIINCRPEVDLYWIYAANIWGIHIS